MSAPQIEHEAGCSVFMLVAMMALILTTGLISISVAIREGQCAASGTPLREDPEEGLRAKPGSATAAPSGGDAQDPQVQP
jgi:hypothetical protein